MYICLASSLVLAPSSSKFLSCLSGVDHAVCIRTSAGHGRNSEFCERLDDGCPWLHGVLWRNGMKVIFVQVCASWEPLLSQLRRIAGSHKLLKDLEIIVKRNSCKRGQIDFAAKRDAPHHSKG